MVDSTHRFRWLAALTRTGFRSDPDVPTGAAAYQARPKATPTVDRRRDTRDRVRTDKVDKTGAVTIRHACRLHHIGIGRTHAGTSIRLLLQDLQITVVNATTGETLRKLTLDPTKDYQPINPPQQKPNPQKLRFGYADVLRHHTAALGGFEPPTQGLGNLCSIP